MANAFQVNTSTVVAGLGTQTYTVPAGVATQLYTCSVRFTVPYRASGMPGDSTSTVGQSGLQIVVNKNGSPILTVGGAATNPTPTQPTIGGSVQTSLAAADVVTVVLSSSNAVDAVANAIKGTINFYQGQGA